MINFISFDNEYKMQVIKTINVRPIEQIEVVKAKFTDYDDILVFTINKIKYDKYDLCLLTIATYNIICASDI
jgi:hypothetical protein